MMFSPLPVLTPPTVGGRRPRIVGRAGDLAVSRLADLSAFADQPTG
jgi:hypothetical protein